MACCCARRISGPRRDRAAAPSAFSTGEQLNTSHRDLFEQVKPPGKTTLIRMQRTAMLEAERIEITQDYWVKDGRIKRAGADLVERRDDFAGMVRLIDAINSDQDLLERLKRAHGGAGQDAPAPAAIEPVEDDGG
jgi:hypothetical protein